MSRSGSVSREAAIEAMVARGTVAVGDIENTTLAPALLAGVPAIVKPASATSYLTEAAVRIMLDANVLPKGALQLVVGGPEHGHALLGKGIDAFGEF